MIARRAVFRLLAGLAAVAGVALAPAAQAQPEQLERAVKATFLVKFGAYVEWPPAALADGAPLTICVVGANPFGDLLDTAAKGQRIGSHPVEVRQIATIDRSSGCHIAYLSEGSAAAVAGAPVLTVSSGRSGLDRAMIDFQLIDGHVRFSIDQMAAQRAGLTISSKLLQIAVSVRQAER